LTIRRDWAYGRCVSSTAEGKGTMIRKGRLCTALGAAVVVTSGAVGIAVMSAQAAPVGPVATPSCSASAAFGSGFTTWFPPQGDGFAGGVGYVLEFSNTGTSVCTVDGFPKVTLTENGRQVGLKAATSGSVPVPVRLAVGRTSHAVLIVHDAGAICRPHPTNGLRVQPPGATQPVTFPFAGGACPGRSTMSVDRISFGTGIPSYTIR
jgi:Protein of unknown function (DUF4232)